MDGMIDKIKAHIQECAGTLYEQAITSEDGCSFAVAEEQGLAVLVCINRETWAHIAAGISTGPNTSIESAGNFHTDPDNPDK